MYAIHRGVRERDAPNLFDVALDLALVDLVIAFDLEDAPAIAGARGELVLLPRPLCQLFRARLQLLQLAFVKLAYLGVALQTLPLLRGDPPVVARLFLYPSIFQLDAGRPLAIHGDLRHRCVQHQGAAQLLSLIHI